MTWEPLFVGGTAMILGLVAMLAAVHNRDFYFKLPKARWLENRVGRAATRWIYFGVGSALFIWGVFVAADPLGAADNRTSRPELNFQHRRSAE